MRTLPRLIILFVATFLLLTSGMLRGKAAAGIASDLSLGRPVLPAALAGPTETPALVQPLIKSTPDANGTIIHVVQYGQALISIANAYGVSITELRDLNSLTSDTIYTGEKLIIRQGATPTITTTPTRTATGTHRPTSTPRPSTPTPTSAAATATLTATPRPAGIDFQLNRQTLGIGIIAVCSLGLVAVGLTAFRKK